MRARSILQRTTVLTTALMTAASSTLLFCSTAYAANTGEQSPTLTAPGVPPLVNAANALACDGVVASATSNGATQDYFGYGFSIPAGVTITGIQVRLRANDGTSANRRMQVSLSWDSGTSFTAPLVTPNFRRNSALRDYYLGGSAFLWGRTWTPAELADPSFRLRVVSKFGSTADPANLDCIPVTVYYSIPGAPNLNILKVGSPDPVQPSAKLTYAISFSNTGSAAATGVQVSDVIPTNTTFVSASPAPASAPPVGGTGTVTWMLGTVPIGGSGTLFLVVQVNGGLPSGTVITNSGYSIVSNEVPATPGNTVTTTVSGPLAISKLDSPDPVRAGGTITYQLTYANNGTVAATGVVITESYDSNLTFVASTPPPDGGFNNQWTIGTLAAGASGTITIILTLPAGLPNGTLINNFASMTDTLGDGANAGAVTTVNEPVLTISETASPNPVASGGTLTLTITYQNLGATTRTGVTIIHAYDSNVSFLSAVPSPDGGTTDTWTIGSLAPGATGTITISATVASGLVDGTTLHNEAQISDDAFASASTGTDTVVLSPPTPTPTATSTLTLTPTLTSTPTNSPTGTPTDTGVATSTSTPTDTPTLAANPTDTPSETATETATPTDTPTATATDTPTSTATPMDTPTAAATDTPTPSPTATPSPSPSATPVITCPVSPVESGCLRPNRSVFLLREAAKDPTKHRMIWRWITRPGTVLSDFGSPLTTTGYAFCVYDHVAGVPVLSMSASVQPDGICAFDRPCWTQIGKNTPRGFRFRDPYHLQDATTQIVLKSNEARRRNKVLYFARGPSLVFPAAASPLFLAQDPKLRVQLVNSEGGCWESEYTAPAIRNGPAGAKNKFKDKCGTRRQEPCR